MGIGAFKPVLSAGGSLSGDNDWTGTNTYNGIVRWSKGADIASATALVLGTDGNSFDVTGTTTITSITTTGHVGTIVRLHFDDAVLLTHSATDLVLPGGANITTAAGDEFTFEEHASGDFRCVAYALASGEAIVGGGIAAVVDDTTPQAGGDFDMNAHQMQWSQGADVASGAALPVLTDGNSFDVTGTTTITTIDTTGGVGTVIKLHFDGILTLTHDGTNIILPGAANITTAAGDEAEFLEYATGDYRCTVYTKVSGEAVVSASASSGSWSPLLSDGTNDATQSITVGEFIKSGDLVYIAGTVRASSLGSMTGPVRITGLPFTSKNLTNLLQTISFNEVSAVSITAGESITGAVDPNVTFFRLRLWDATTGNSDLLTSELNTTSFLRFSGSYIAAP